MLVVDSGPTQMSHPMSWSESPACVLAQAAQVQGPPPRIWPQRPIIRAVTGPYASCEHQGGLAALLTAAIGSQLWPHASQPPHSLLCEPKGAQGRVSRRALSPQGPGQGQGLGSVRSQRRPLALSRRERAGALAQILRSRFRQSRRGGDWAPVWTPRQGGAEAAGWVATRGHAAPTDRLVRGRPWGLRSA